MPSPPARTLSASTCTRRNSATFLRRASCSRHAAIAPCPLLFTSFTRSRARSRLRDKRLRAVRHLRLIELRHDEPHVGAVHFGAPFGVGELGFERRHRCFFGDRLRAEARFELEGRGLGGGDVAIGFERGQEHVGVLQGEDHRVGVHLSAGLLRDRVDPTRRDGRHPSRLLRYQPSRGAHVAFERAALHRGDHQAVARHRRRGRAQGCASRRAPPAPSPTSPRRRRARRKRRRGGVRGMSTDPDSRISCQQANALF